MHPGDFCPAGAHRPLVLSRSSTVDPRRWPRRFLPAAPRAARFHCNRSAETACPQLMCPHWSPKGLSWKKRWYWPFRKIGPLGSLIQLGGALKCSCGCQSEAAGCCALACAAKISAKARSNIRESWVMNLVCGGERFWLRTMLCPERRVPARLNPIVAIRLDWSIRT